MCHILLSVLCDAISSFVAMVKVLFLLEVELLPEVEFGSEAPLLKHCISNKYVILSVEIKWQNYLICYINQYMILHMNDTNLFFSAKIPFSKTRI